MNADKTGTRTTEFMIAVALIGLIAFRDRLGVTLDPDQINNMVWLAMTYIGGRNLTKLAALLGIKIPESAPDPERRNPNAS